MRERDRKGLRAAEMRWLQRNTGCSLPDRKRNEMLELEAESLA